MKKIIGFVLILTIALSLVSCGQPKIVKNVGGFDVDSELDSFFGGDDNALALFFAPYSLADSVGYDRNSEEFAALCKAERARMLSEDYRGDEDALEEDVERNGLTMNLYEKFTERDVLTDELFERLTSDGTIVSEEATVREKLLSGAAVRVKRIIIIDDEAEKLIKEAAEKTKNSSFESVRQSYASYAPAGEIGNYEDSFIVVEGNYDERYENACFSLDIGGISEPVETAAGWCIVKRYEMTPDMIDGIISDLVPEYKDGQFNIMLEKAAEKLLREEIDK